MYVKIYIGLYARKNVFVIVCLCIYRLTFKMLCRKPANWSLNIEANATQVLRCLFVIYKFSSYLTLVKRAISAGFDHR